MREASVSEKVHSDAANARGDESRKKAKVLSGAGWKQGRCEFSKK
jgi:hypothetical protein